MRLEEPVNHGEHLLIICSSDLPDQAAQQVWGRLVNQHHQQLVITTTKVGSSLPNADHKSNCALRALGPGKIGCGSHLR